MIRRFYCGKCKEKNFMTRKGLREHLRKVHLIKRDLVSFKDVSNRKKTQPWWKFEELEK